LTITSPIEFEMSDVLIGIVSILTLNVTWITIFFFPKFKKMSGFLKAGNLTHAACRIVKIHDYWKVVRQAPWLMLKFWTISYSLDCQSSAQAERMAVGTVAVYWIMLRGHL